MGGKERRGRRDKHEYVKVHVNRDRCYAAAKAGSSRWSNQASKDMSSTQQMCHGVINISNSDQGGHLDGRIFLPCHDDFFVRG